MDLAPVVLEGRWLRLEPLDERHAEDLFRVMQDPEVCRYLTWPPPAALAETRALVREAQDLMARRQSLVFAQVWRETGRAIGSTRLLDVRPADRQVEIGATFLARDRWRSVNGTFGVTRLVMQGDRPAAAPHGIVEALIDTCGEDGVLRWQPALQPGRPVRVLTGPFAELIGELDRMSDGGRVRVLLNIMGTGTSVLLPRDNLVHADSCL